MSNIAGKAYGMNVITPIRWYTVWVSKLTFWLVVRKPLSSRLKGLVTLSLIHYARWTIIDKFPRLAPEQPEEDLKYTYMLFHSNFNGSWDQYVDSFTFAIPSGLDSLWRFNVHYPKSVPLTKFHHYIRRNQVDTNHYYTAYPMASSNDVKSGKQVFKALVDFQNATLPDETAEAFAKRYEQLVNRVQHDIGPMGPTPIVSLASQAVSDKRREQKNEL